MQNFSAGMQRYGKRTLAFWKKGPQNLYLISCLTKNK